MDVMHKKEKERKIKVRNPCAEYVPVSISKPEVTMNGNTSAYARQAVVIQGMLNRIKAHLYSWEGRGVGWSRTQWWHTCLEYKWSMPPPPHIHKMEN